MGKKYFSIGEFAQISGATIKQLRYYDRAGLLKPAHTDQNTNFRYYSLEQCKLVDAIRTCVELDLPLQSFTDYLTNNTGEAIPDCATILSAGENEIAKELSHIKAKQMLIDDMRQSLKRHQYARKMIRTKKPFNIEYFSQNYYYLEPIKGLKTWKNTGSSFYYNTIKQGFTPGSQYGRLYIHNNGEWKEYQCINILSPANTAKNIVCCPDGDFPVAFTTKPGLKAVSSFIKSAKLHENDPQIILELELLANEFQEAQSIYEVRLYEYFKGFIS